MGENKMKNRTTTSINKVLNAIKKAGFRLIRTNTGAIELISFEEICLPGEILIKRAKNRIKR